MHPDPANLEKRAALGRSIMSQHSATASSFTATCPGCGLKLRFALGPDMPGRLRIQCSSCKMVFAVRRPGADATQLSMTGATPPTLIGMPVQGPAPAAASPAGRRDAPTFAPGAVLAQRYKVVRFIARGGMGEVYEVDDLELRERVALKTVRPEVAGDTTTVERFRREIQLARKVTHPNVCRIFDVSHHRPEDGAPGVIFLTMELLLGETLAERLRRAGPVQPPEALPIARQVADALYAAHQAGVVHRDLKPGNIMLVEGRGTLRAVVTDFGLARLESGEDHQGLALTAAGVVGTPAYLAPEQIEGKEVTPAVDVYAFGIVLYEMLTGTVPFIGDTALSTAVKRLQEAPPSPRLHAPGLDQRWEAAILRCLAREPAGRFPTAPAAVEAISRAEPQRLGPNVLVPPSPEPAGARRSAPPAPQPPLWKRRGTQAGLLAALVLASLTVGWLRYREWKERQMEPEQRLAMLVERITPRRAVAILGFKNLSGTPGTEWLSGGLAEMLSTELGSGGKLRIIAGENVARAKLELGLGDADSLARDSLGRLRTQLGTDAVVLGSYTTIDGPQGRQIRLDLRLQDAVRGETTATVAEAGTEAQLFDLVSRIGKRLRRELGVRDEGEARTVKAALPSSPEAARLYSEGLNKLRLFDPVGARDLLLRAVAADPDSALAHSSLSAAWSALGYDGKASEEAKTAYDLAADLPQEERLLIEGRYLETVQDWSRAAEIYWNLWSLFPDNLDYGLRLAAAQTAAGKVDEALATATALRGLPPPSNEDTRIDLAEAMAAGAQADFKRQETAAARAAGKAQAHSAPLMVAQARLLECRALRNLGQAQKALDTCDEGRRLYAAAGDRAGVAESLTHAANVLYDRGDLPAASQLYNQALATYHEIGNRGGEAGALNNIAVVLKSQGDLDHARELYEKVLAISRETGSRGGEAYALNNLAGVFLRRSELDQAGQFFEQALAIRRSQGDKSGVAYALDNFGVVLRKRGDLARARQQHEESLRIRRQIGQRIGETASLNNRGTVLLEQGELAAARKDFTDALRLSQETGSKSASAYALFGVGEVLARQGDLTGARQRHEKALALRRGLGEKATAAESEAALASILLDAGDPAHAEEFARSAADELARQGATAGQAMASATAALAAAAQGNEPAAREAIDRAVALAGTGQDLRARLTVQLRAAQLHRSADPGQALQAVLAQATQAGLLDLQLEAGLALARIEMEHGHAAEGQARLASVQQEAKALGYGLIAKKAGG
jgi:tetratricopeptide (TPR) repeat protein/tRNA A-37 threonylcarbamoyl transferase component Bud32/TolB-like protein